MPKTLPKQVLVVEDQENIAIAIAHVLTRGGHAATLAATGAAAQDAIALLCPDLVLLDVMLPDMCGFDLCADLRRNPALAGMPVLMMTARGDPADAATARAVGANGLILKPFDLATLRSDVDRLLRAGTLAIRA